ncbi:PREDICTED: chymotrypsin-1 [Nicrophorus vespilloides]|uniref:Chymotrypsin-1 n=1 Tax=Nicrophorus vespilloides TaxID=110193 RepID=A0ABM1MCQ7_NICVS|nr:PREDICTED: chymotrypsin-1 [Nicrophorus vespilloides]
MTKVAFIVLCGLVGALAAPRDLGWRIVGGHEAGEAQFPYQVSLRYGGSHTCGGSILDETTILCAAHCVDGRMPSMMTVVVGSHYLSEGGVSHQVKSFVVHEQYDSYRIQNDVSILKLDTPISFNTKVQAVKLPTSNIGGDADVILSGWGRTNYPGDIPDELQYIQLRTLTVETCQKLQSAMDVIESEVCTLTKSGEGACHGDSGGPLVDFNGNQIGIVSWGTPCARGFPDVFTRVFSFLDWIAQNRH